MTTRRHRRELHDGWRLRLARADHDTPIDHVDIDATVPGVVHLDLLRDGLIADPYLDRNEDTQHWIGRSDWEYRCELSAVAALVGDHDRIDLVCDGLDTVATLSLDGREIGSTANQHRTYRFDVTDAIRDASDRASLDLIVRFDAPAVYAEQQRDAIGDLPNPYGLPFNFIRKMACNFGWDWGPQLTTSGIWKPIGIEAWSGVRLAAVRPSVDVVVGEGAAAGDVGVVDLSVDLEWASAVDIELRVDIGGRSETTSVAAGTTTATMRVEVPDVVRWWPIGRGTQYRYDLNVSAIGIADEQAGTVFDETTKRIGFRTVEVDTTPADDGSRWAIKVNGERVWVRGTNWIPDDCFPSRVDRARYERRIDQAAAANVNLLRIWGGGIYESDDFYDLCDERGILVWQDFLFACAAYDEDSLRDEVRAEAEDAIDRLMSHPSLVLWNGNNENHWGWWSWGWPDKVGDRTWGLGFYEQLLPDVVTSRDPRRPYLPGSPSSGDPSRHPNDQDHGPMHIWKIWNEVDYVHYRDYLPRFVSEFGFQGPPTHATLERAISTRPLAADDANVLHHQKAFDGHAKLARGLAPHFDSPTSFDDWLFLTQINQARAVAVGVQHLRRLHDRCSGAILWQLNDCWPVVSWAVIDGDERLKPAWFSLRSSFADHLLLVEPDGDGVGLFAVNDTRRAWRTSVTVRRIDVDGTELGAQTIDIDVPPDGSFKRLLGADLCEPGDAARSLLVADAEGLRSVHTWNEDRMIDYPMARFTSEVQRIDNDLDDVVATRLTVRAVTLLRDLCVFADRLDPTAQVDHQMVTLLPGEAHSFMIRSEQPLDAEALQCSPVLRCVNDR